MRLRSSALLTSSGQIFPNARPSNIEFIRFIEEHSFTNQMDAMTEIQMDAVTEIKMRCFSATRATSASVVSPDIQALQQHAPQRGSTGRHGTKSSSTPSNQNTFPAVPV
jgi:hypothetical protein